MKILFSLFLIIFSLQLSAQNETNDARWVLPCDSLTSQSEMNRCSAEKVAKADSTLISVYTTLLNYLNENLENQKKVTTNKKDKAQKDYIKNLRSKIDDFKESQDQFDAYKKSTLNIIRRHYDGGSIKPLAVNLYALQITIDRIKLLEVMSEEMMR